ncbi:uncharacterized protein DS421_10g308430 [Arachis hypogaea]|nr:uncharacterized protein DS421_10g308430 [Arachis hypogaea]
MKKEGKGGEMRAVLLKTHRKVASGATRKKEGEPNSVEGMDRKNARRNCKEFSDAVGSSSGNTVT